MSTRQYDHLVSFCQQHKGEILSIPFRGVGTGGRGTRPHQYLERGAGIWFPPPNIWHWFCKMLPKKHGLSQCFVLSTWQSRIPCDFFGRLAIVAIFRFFVPFSEFKGRGVGRSSRLGKWVLIYTFMGVQGAKPPEAINFATTENFANPMFSHFNFFRVYQRDIRKPRNLPVSEFGWVMHLEASTAN